MSARLTEHARRRMQQRGVSELQLELLRLFGEDHYQKGGSTLTYVPERKLALLRQAVDRLAGVAVVKGASDNVVTVMHLGRRIGRTELVA